MLGSPSSPYRNWAPTAAHGVYSLFPNDSLYQPSARYHHTLSHPKESLFTLTTPPVFHSPIPTVIPQQSVPVERGITQLELMTKGFNNNNNNTNANNNNNNNSNGKRFDGRNTPNNNNNTTKKRWESPDTPVKNETTNRNCSCRHSPSPSRLILPRVSSDTTAMFGGGSAHGGEPCFADRTKKEPLNTSGGCSRTNPVSLRSNVTGNGADMAGLNNNNNSGVWSHIVIKKEPGHGVTPCQVPEVTTSVTPLASIVKIEEAGVPCGKDMTATGLPTVGNAIPVGIAVARQRTQEKGGSTAQTMCNNNGGQTEMQQSPISTMALVQSAHCEDRLTNGLSPWASTTNHTSAMTPPTSTLWQYPALGVDAMPPVGYQLVREPVTGHYLLIPATGVLWPSYQPQSLHSAQLTTHHAAQLTTHHATQLTTQHAAQLTTHHSEPLAYDQQRILMHQPQQQQQQQQQHTQHQSQHQTQQQSQPQIQPLPPVEPKRRTMRVKEEKMQEVHPPTQQVLMESEPQPFTLDNGKRSQATSPVSCMTPSENTGSQYECEDNVATVAQISVQDASNQTDTLSVSEDETLPLSCDMGSSLLSTRSVSSDISSTMSATQASNTSVGVGTDVKMPPLASNVKCEVDSPIAESKDVSTRSVTVQEVKREVDECLKKENNSAVPGENEPRETSSFVDNDKCDRLPTHSVASSHPPVDLSGLELLSNSIEQFEKHRINGTNKSVSESLISNVITTDDRSNEISEETAAEMLQLLSTRKERVNFTRDNYRNNDSTKVQDYCSEDREVHNIFKSASGSKVQESVVVDDNNSLFGGLGLLCALAEQRILEEVGTNTNPEAGLITRKRFSDSDQSDVSRTYKTQKSELECKKFFAKVNQHYTSRPNSPSAMSIVSCVSPPLGEMIGAKELDVRMRLAEVQRQYREKQKELSKLTPKKFDIDYVSCPTKRGPGRPRKKCGKFNLDSPPESPKSKTRRDPPPPPTEKISDTRWPSDSSTRFKTSKVDILKPPTLTTNRILTSAKFKPEMKSNGTNGATNSCIVAGKGIKMAASNLNSTKLGENVLKTKESEKTEKIKNKTENCMDKKSAFPCSRANHTFGSKPPARLPRPGETESMFWFKSSPEPPVKTEEKLPQLSTTLTFSSSKKRKVGRPKKHLTTTSVSTETIVAKKPKSKSSLVGLLLNKSRRLSSSDVPSTFKSSGAYTRPLALTGAYVPTSVSYKNNITDRTSASVEVFPGAESQVFTNGVSDKKKEPEEVIKSHKILPKLKAEAKVKTWTCGDEDDVLDWVHGKKEERFPPIPSEHIISKAIKRKLSVTSVKSETQGSKNKIPKKSTTKEQIVKLPMPTTTPKILDTLPTPTKTLTPPAASTKVVATSVVQKANGIASVKSPPNKKRLKKSSSLNTSTSSSGSSESINVSTCSSGTSESDDIPLSIYSKKPACRCLLTESHLETERLRALALMGGLFYAGELSPIQPPDVYGIKLDGERGNKPHILTREEVLKDAILEVKVSNISELSIGARVCAYWSQQYRCLYPGTVAPNADDAHSTLVSVEFDDGDNGRIGVDDIRLLPDGYPIVEYDPNPLLTLGKRKRQASGASCDSHSRRTSADIAPALAPAQPKPPQSTVTRGVLAKSADEMDNRPQVETLNRVISTKVKTEDATNEDEDLMDSKERKRLKKRRRDKLKRLNSLPADIAGKKRKKKHRICDERCRHRRHHRRHHKHKHRHSRNAKDTDKVDGDALSRLSPVLEQLDILEIQQTAIRQLTNENKLKEEKERKKEAKKEAKKEEKMEILKEEKVKLDEEVAEEKSVAMEAKKTKKETAKAAKKVRDRQPSVESRSKMAAFLPARQLWSWSGRGFKRPGGRGRGKKEFFKSIQRGKETINAGDCAVFLSTGLPDRPYIGRIETMWESWGTNMVVKVKWFYHPEETIGCPPKLKYPGALFESPHVDENDVQTISHKCEVMPLEGYVERVGAEPGRLATVYDNNDIYYQAGYYDPTNSHLKLEKGVV